MITYMGSVWLSKKNRFMQHHHRSDAGAHILDYSLSFGNTVIGLKRTTIWSTYYFTNKKSSLPHSNTLVKILGHSLTATTASCIDEHQDFMREWARNNGKTMRQRTVRQETTKIQIRHNSVEHTSDWRANWRETTVWWGKRGKGRSNWRWQVVLI